MSGDAVSAPSRTEILVRPSGPNGDFGPAQKAGWGAVPLHQVEGDYFVLTDNNPLSTRWGGEGARRAEGEGMLLPGIPSVLKHCT